jgi:hypothetical protein
VIEDSALRRLLGMSDPVDLLIVDGDHRYAREMADYTAALPALASAGVLLSDTARYSTALRDFARTHARAYAFWAEKPVRHFFAGDGIGLSLPTEG